GHRSDSLQGKEGNVGSRQSEPLGIGVLVAALLLVQASPAQDASQMIERIVRGDVGLVVELGKSGDAQAIPILRGAETKAKYGPARAFRMALARLGDVESLLEIFVEFYDRDPWRQLHAMDDMEELRGLRGNWLVRAFYPLLEDGDAPDVQNDVIFAPP